MLAALAAGGVPVRAADPSAEPYLAGIRAARAVIQTAAPGDQAKAETAIRRLGPEAVINPDVVADLNRVPPDFLDADRRLAAAENVMQRSADTPDPASARATLDRILADPRYTAAGPSLWDRFWNFLVSILRWFAEHLGLGGWGAVGLLIELTVLATALALVAYFGYRLLRSRPLGGAGLSAEQRRRLSLDRFAEADRLEAAGDLAGAIRALAGGVATVLGGEGAWEESPFTVRELFQTSGVLEPLRPLLLPFERSEYGRRPPTPEEYAAALLATAPYRQGELPLREAA